MKNISSNLPEGSSDEPGPDDVYAKVRGNSKTGTADMYGLGVRQSDIWGEKKICADYRLENSILKAKLEQYEELLQDKNGSTDHSVNSNVQAATTTQTPILANTPRRLQVGNEVFLKSIDDYNQNVARGWLKSLDPNDVVGGRVIGKRWCEVNVQQALKPDEELIRPYGHFDNIQDCVGASIAWPCSLISAVPLD